MQSVWHALFSNCTLAYFSVTVIYTRKMLMKLIPGANGIKLFLSVIYEFCSNLEGLLD